MLIKNNILYIKMFKMKKEYNKDKNKDVVFLIKKKPDKYTILKIDDILEKQFKNYTIDYFK